MNKSKWVVLAAVLAWTLATAASVVCYAGERAGAQGPPDLLVNLLLLAIFVGLASASFRWHALTRTTWGVLWGVLAVVFCVTARSFGREEDLAFSVAAMAGLGSAGLWGIALLPAFLLGAWLRRRRRPAGDGADIGCSVQSVASPWPAREGPEAKGQSRGTEGAAAWVTGIVLGLLLCRWSGVPCCAWFARAECDGRTPGLT